MTKLTTYCDHCGKELNEMKDYIGIELFELTIQYVCVDLCADCRKELSMQALKFCGREEVLNEP